MRKSVILCALAATYAWMAIVMFYGYRAYGVEIFYIPFTGLFTDYRTIILILAVLLPSFSFWLLIGILLRKIEKHA